MPSILLITKNGFVQEDKMVNEIVDITTLHKIAGFRNNNGFLLQETFIVSLNEVEYKISLYGKIKGKSNDTNKYVFHPLSIKKYIGNCLLIRHDLDNSILPLFLNEWDQIKDIIFNEIKTTNAIRQTKINIKKKDLKKTIVTNVEDKLLSNTYLDCSKELTFENFI